VGEWIGGVKREQVEGASKRVLTLWGGGGGEEKKNAVLARE